jgi:hypothetical protein
MFHFALPKSKWFLPRWNPLALDMLLRIVAAFVLHRGKMTASQAAGVVGIAARHRANVGRFLERRKSLHDGVLLNHTARRILKREWKRKGCWVLALDQTYVGHQGEQTENTFSRANYKPRKKSSRRRQRKTTKHACHAFVIGLLISPRGCRIPLMKSYYTKAFAKQKQLPFKTQAKLAAELIMSAPVPPGAEVLVLGDTAYDAITIRQACDQRGWQWIVPANPERVLQGPKPRRKLKQLVEDLQPNDWSLIRFTANSGPWAEHQRVAACRRGSIKHTRTYYAHRERQNVQRIGATLVVFSVKQKPKPGQTVKADKILLTNALKLSCKAVLEAYSLRWQIELMFRELKSTLGFADYKFREYAKVDGWVNACLLTFLWLEFQRQEALRKRKLDARQRRWWQCQRTHGLCCGVRQQIQLRDLQQIEQWSKTPSGQRKLRRAIKAAYPHEYQAA